MKGDVRYQTPLRNARGLGSARGGTRHWWRQRVTALILIPLAFWLAAVLAAWPQVAYPELVAWVSSPWNTVVLLALIPVLFHHATLGVQVVLEDYVHVDWLKILAVLTAKVALAFLALASMFAVLRLVFVG